MLDASWVRGCTQFVRSVFARQGNLHGVDAALTRLYGSHGFLSGTAAVPASMAMSTGDGSASSQPALAALVSSTSMPFSVSLGKPSIYRVTNKNWVVRSSFIHLSTLSALFSLLHSL